MVGDALLDSRLFATPLTPPMPLVGVWPVYLLRRTQLTRSLSRSSQTIGQFGAAARMSTAAPFPRRWSKRPLA
jgi:hypothetical protein